MELRETLLAVEEAISAPAPGRVAAWVSAVVARLDQLSEAFDAHVEGTEAPGGLYEEILELAPHLAGKVRRLRDEHPQIAESIGAEHARLMPFSADADASIDLLRDDLQRLLGRIVRHRQHGADLIWEAYNVDIGGAG